MAAPGPLTSYSPCAFLSLPQAFLALISKYRPDVLRYEEALAECKGDAREQVALAFRIARSVGRFIQSSID